MPAKTSQLCSIRGTRRGLVALACGAMMALAGCAADQLQREGMRAIEAGQYEQGVNKLSAAAKADPGDVGRKITLLGSREEAVQALIRSADQARSAGELDAAGKSYRRVLEIDAGNSRARAGLAQLDDDRRHAGMIAEAGKQVELGRFTEAEAVLRAVLEEDPGNAEASALRAKIDAARGPRNVAPHLQARDNKPVTLQFRDASTKMVFEVLSRQTGINFIFDKDVRDNTKTTIYVNNVSIEQAIALILAQNQLGKQVLAPNMAIIYPDTAAKQKDYQDHIVRSFYLVNAEPKRVADLLKTVLDAKTLFTDERTNLLVMRDTPEAVRMAERLIASIDVPEAEVMLEVEVLEITRSKLQELGVSYPTSITLKPTPLAGDPLVLADFKDQDETTIKVSDVAVGLNLLKTVGDSNVLASPRIRARNREKAKILIGSRVPVVTNSITATANGNIANGSVQYMDVGLTLDVDPTIRISGDVAIKVKLEVSTIVKQLSVPTGSGGETLAYEIGTRQADTMLELKDGETQILAGLISDSDRRSSSRIPGLGDIPVIGRLFSNHSGNREKSEIVLSITPRIVRAQARASSENVEFWYGTESQQRAAPLASAIAGRSAAGTALVEPPLAGGGAGAAADSGGSGGATTGGEEGDNKPAAPRRASLTLDGQPSVAVGEEFTVSLNISDAVGIASIRSMLRFDQQVLQFVGGSAGTLAGGDGPRLDAGGGRVRFDVDGATINGSGPLVELRFKALGPRPQTMIAMQQFAGSDANGTVQSIMAPRPLVISVTP